MYTADSTDICVQMYRGKVKKVVRKINIDTLKKYIKEVSVVRYFPPLHVCSFSDHQRAMLAISGLYVKLS